MAFKVAEHYRTYLQGALGVLLELMDFIEPNVHQGVQALPARKGTAIMDTAWPGTVVSPKNFSSSGLDLEPLFHLADLKTNFAPSPRRGPCAGPPLSSFPLNLAHRESPLPLKLSLEVPGTTPRCAVPALPSSLLATRVSCQSHLP